MARVDLEYHKLLNKILSDGDKRYDESRKIGTQQLSSYTLDLTNSISIPIITTKKIFYKSVLAELDFFLKGQTNIRYLLAKNCTIWNKDAYNYYLELCKKNNITAILGFDAFIYSIKNKETLYKVDLPKGYELGDLGPVYGSQWHYNNQFQNLLENLKANNFDRRLIVNAWNTDELDDMALPPCHWAFEALQHRDGFILKWHQRSVDVFLGLPFNILSYHILGMLISLMTGVRFYGAIGDLSNVHIYDNHLDAVKEQLSRDIYTHGNRDIRFLADSKFVKKLLDYRQEKMSFNRLLESIDLNEIDIIGYDSHPVIKADMLAKVI